MKRLLLTAAALVASPAAAGPPYITDDPQPTDLHHWEIYAFAGGSRAGGATDGVTGLDLNYGALPGVQLTATLPFAFSTAGTRTAFGDAELGLKYRFYNRGGTAFAIFPRIIVPTAGAGRSSGKVGVLLPLWGQHDIGNWSVFGGGGYAINPGKGARDFVQGSLAVTRSLGERLSLGGEIAGHTADARGGRGYAALNFGGGYKLFEHVALIASAGPGIVHANDGGKWNAYFAVAATF